MRNELLSESLYSLFFPSLSFSSFDNVGSLKLKLARLNVDLNNSSKAPRNLVRKFCLPRPLFSALSLYVVEIEGKKIKQ